MKKNIEWLKEKLLRELMQFKSNPSMTDYEIGIKSGIRTAINLTEKLDKQELTQLQVDKWLDERDMVAVDAMMVYQTGMQNKVVAEKPVIPQFAADYIEKWKYERLIMHEWFTFDHDNEDEDKVSKWLYNNDDETNKRREFMLIDAIRYGYELEKEKRYRVVLPFTVWDGYASEMKESAMFLALDITSGETRFPHFTANVDGYRTDLTESQIKGIDKRYWAFAQEATE